jgi:hypothetical protein
MKNSKNKLVMIGPEYGFEISSLCYTLFQRRISQKGREYWDLIGYYTSLEAMYLRLVECGQEPSRDFQDIYNRQIELKTWIAESIQKLIESPSFTVLRDKSMLAIPRGLKKYGIP